MLEITVDHAKESIQVTSFDVLLAQDLAASSRRLSQLAWLPNTLLSLDSSSACGSISIHPFIFEKRILNTIEDRLRIFNSVNDDAGTRPIAQFASVDITSARASSGRIMFYAISADCK